MLEVAAAYLIAALLVGCALLMGILIASAIRNRAGARGRLVLILIGILLVGIAGLERMGWPVRPWRPGSPAQDFDDFLFRVIWLTGIGFLFVGGMVGFFSTRETSSRVGTEAQAERKMPRLVKN